MIVLVVRFVEIRIILNEFHHFLQFDTEMSSHCTICILLAQSSRANNTGNDSCNSTSLGWTSLIECSVGQTRMTSHMTTRRQNRDICKRIDLAGTNRTIIERQNSLGLLQIPNPFKVSQRSNSSNKFFLQLSKSMSLLPQIPKKIRIRLWFIGIIDIGVCVVVIVTHNNLGLLCFRFLWRCGFWRRFDFPSGFDERSDLFACVQISTPVFFETRNHLS